MSSGFNTRIERDQSEPYTVIFYTDDESKYREIEDACRKVIGHGKENRNERTETKAVSVLRR